MPLKILNWNIQTFGVTRQQDADTMRQVCRVLNDAQADIACIQELVVSNWNDADSIVTSINNGLLNLGALQYNYILCPWNRFETYLYLYRAGVNLQAVTLGAAGPASVDNAGVSTATWTAYQGNTGTGFGPTGLDHYFPLFLYDKIGNAARPPGFGLFRYTDGFAVSRYICLLNWHNDASGTSFIQGNISRLAQTAIINAGHFNINAGGGVQNVNNIILAGDFNDALSPCPFPNYTRQFNVNTHLYNFDKNNDGTYTTSLALRDAAYDNLVTCLNGLGAANQQVMDLPLRLMNEKKHQTKTALLASDLLAQANQQLDYRNRIISRIRSSKKSRRKISKTSLGTFRTLLKDVNLGRVRVGTMRTKINGLTIPPAQKAILVTFALTFIEKELTTVSRWVTRSRNMNGLLYNDALYLTREWMSDHLPLVITL